jgi:hypothetical protein
VKALIESAGPVFPALLEISYTLVYSMPFIGLAVLYAYRRRERADRLLFPLVLSVLSAYVLFPYFPSEPPRTVFPGEDFPSYVSIFRQFNWAMLGSYGIHNSVFPSAHVSGSFAKPHTQVCCRKWPGGSAGVSDPDRPRPCMAATTGLADAAAGSPALAVCSHGPCGATRHRTPLLMFRRCIPVRRDSP